MTTKRRYEFECPHCGGHFVEMKARLFHRCPGRGDTRPVRPGNRRHTYREGISDPVAKRGATDSVKGKLPAAAVSGGSVPRCGSFRERKMRPPVT